MRRSDKEIIDLDTIHGIVRGCEVCRLGLAVDGEPYVVPISFGFDGEAVYFHTATNGRKIDMMTANPRACVQFERNVELVTDDDDTLKRVGLSRQKTEYARILAAALDDGELDLDGLEDLPDEEVRKRLMDLKGIGRWTADIYLLMALGRSDVWPVGDLALVTAAMRVKKLDVRPTPDEFERLGDAWRPWRSVAARLLWHHYLSAEDTD